MRFALAALLLSWPPFAACAAAPPVARPVQAPQPGEAPGGATGQVHEELLFSTRGMSEPLGPLFTPDGRHHVRRVLYGWWREQYGFVVDGVVGPRYRKVHEAAMTDDGAHVIYAGQSKGRWQIVADGRPWPRTFGRLLSNFSLWGPWATFAGGDRGWAVIVPDESSRTRATLRALLVPWGREERTTLLIDGEEVSPPELRSIVALSLAFSPDHKRLAYAGRRHDGRFALIVDGQAQGQPFDAVSVHAVAWSPDSRRWAYAARVGERYVVTVDGATQGDWGIERDFPLRFSPDGAHLLYAAREGQDAVVVLDGRVVYRTRHLASAPVFDGRGRWQVIARPADGVLVEVREGVELARLDVPRGVHDTSRLELSPDGDRRAYRTLVSYLTLRHRHYEGVSLVVDGTPYLGGSADLSAHAVSLPIFSPDSRHLAYVARLPDPARGEILGRARKSQAVVLDDRGARSPFYEEIEAHTVRFEDERTLAFVARRDKAYWRVTWRPPALAMPAQD